MGAGKHVLLADMRQENAQAAADVLADAGFETSTATVDVSSREVVRALVATATGLGEVTGLIHAAVPDEDFAAELARVVEHLSHGAGVAYRATKQAIASATLGHLDAALDLERDLQVDLFSTEDFAEGTTAFMQKRAPKFVGR